MIPIPPSDGRTIDKNTTNRRRNGRTDEIDKNTTNRIDKNMRQKKSRSNKRIGGGMSVERKRKERKRMIKFWKKKSGDGSGKKSHPDV